jgi:hypothetical protein
MGRNNKHITFYFNDDERERHHRVVVIFIAILAFIAIFVPIFGTTLRYQTSHLFQEIFNTIGSLAKLAGIILATFGFISIFISKRIKIGALIFGALLLWIGCFLTYTPFTLFGITIGGSQPPTGYH